MVDDPQFGAGAMLDIEVPQSETRSARQTIEDEVAQPIEIDVLPTDRTARRLQRRLDNQQFTADVEMQSSGGAGAMMQSGAGGGTSLTDGGVSTVESLLEDMKAQDEERNEILIQILDILDNANLGQGGGGGFLPPIPPIFGGPGGDDDDPPRDGPGGKPEPETDPDTDPDPNPNPNPLPIPDVPGLPIGLPDPGDIPLPGPGPTPTPTPRTPGNPFGGPPTGFPTPTPPEEFPDFPDPTPTPTPDGTPTPDPITTVPDNIVDGPVGTPDTGTGTFSRRGVQEFGNPDAPLEPFKDFLGENTFEALTGAGLVAGGTALSLADGPLPFGDAIGGPTATKGLASLLALGGAGSAAAGGGGQTAAGTSLPSTVGQNRTRRTAAAPFGQGPSGGGVTVEVGEITVPISGGQGVAGLESEIDRKITQKVKTEVRNALSGSGTTRSVSDQQQNRFQRGW